MDFTALFVCAKILNIRSRILRFITASAIGGIYAVLSLFISEDPVLSFILSMVLPFIMCGIAYGVRGGRLISSAAVFFGVSFLMGGIISYVYLFINKYLTGRGVLVGGNTDMLYTSLPLWSLAVVAFISAAVSSVWGRLAKRKIGTKTGTVEISDKNRHASFEALCDSGNLLTEPISGAPVIVVNRKIAEKIIDPDMVDAFCSSDVSAIKEHSFLKIRIIPIKTVKGEGIMLGYLPGRVTVLGKEVRAYIAAGSDTDSFDGYDGIIPISLIDT